MRQNEMPTLKELKAMSQVDITSVDRNTLVDIESVRIDKDLPYEERMADYIRQIKNPYCYLYKGMIIKVSFTGERNIEDCLKESLFGDT